MDALANGWVGGSVSGLGGGGGGGVVVMVVVRRVRVTATLPCPILPPLPGIQQIALSIG